MNKKFTRLTAALALLVGLAIPLGMWGESTTVASFSRSGTTNTTSGGTFTATFSAKSGYYQDDSGERYMQILNNSAYWTTTPNSISFAAVIGGGSGNTDLTDPVYVALLDANGNVISGTQTAVTSYITTNTGDNYNITIPATNNVYGVKLSHNKQNGFNVRYYSFSLSYEEGGGSQTETHTLTFNASPANGGTVTVGTSTSGSIILEEGATVNITATPAEVGYAFSNWTLNPTTTGASLGNANNASTTFTMGEDDVELIANFSTVTTYTVTYHANVTGIDDIELEYNAGTDVTVAENTFSNPNHSFTKWNTNEGGTGTDYLPGATIENISEDIDLYAQWEEVNEVVDVIDRAFTGITGGSGYGNWSGKVGASGAEYAGNSAGGASTSNPSIQLRTSNSNSGIVSTTSGGKVTQVEVTWNSSTSSGRKLDIYGKNSAYSAATDLYGDNAGTLIGSITCGNNNSTVLTINNDYTFIGMRSNNNAIYLDEIQITWEPVSSDVVATPVINPNGGSFWESQEVSITCATDGATIYYTTDGTDPTTGSAVYSAPFTITANTTVKAFAVKADMTDSEIATAEFTKGTAMTVAQAIVNTPSSGNVYIHGIVSSFFNTSIVGDGTNYRYYISDDGTTTTQLLVYKGKGLNQATFTNANDLLVGDEVVIYGSLITYQDAPEVASGNYLVSLVRPEKVATPTFEPAGGTYYAAQSVTITCATEGATIYYTTDGNDPTTESSVYSEAIAVSESTTIKAFAVVDGKDDSDIATAEYIIDHTPTITVSPATATPSASDTDGTLDLTYANLSITDMTDFDIQYCNAEGEEAEQPDWIEVLVAEQDHTIGEGYVVSYTMDENTVAEARTAYFKVYAMDGEGFVYSNLVTVTQAAFVIDYATLPFEWEGGLPGAFTELNGTTLNSVGSYPNQQTYQMKLDEDDDYIQVKTDSQPGKVTIGVKMVGGASTSTITVQGSANGETFTDIEALTISGKQNDELTLETNNAFGANDRYVRMLFTKGSNVGVGPISIAKVDNTPAITLSTYEVSVNANGHDGDIVATPKNIDMDLGMEIYYYATPQSEEPLDNEDKPNWITATIDNTTISYSIAVNGTEEARIAYFKVFGYGTDESEVYSDLVTVTQAAPAPTYTVNFELDGGTFVPNDVFTEDIVEVEAGTYALPSATKDGNSFAGWKLAGTETTYAAGENFEVNADVSFTAQWTAVITYSLVTSMNQIVSGKHYIIASGTSTSTNVKAMGAQNANNRSSVAVTFTGDKIKETENVREVIINGPDKDGHYIIYDPIADGSYEAGYLYAAGTSTSTNYLKKQSFNDNRGVWTISINNDEAAVITSLTDKTDRNTIRYNSSSSGGIFSCYGPTNQAVVYLYVKDVNPSYDYYKDIAAYTGDKDNYYLIASPIDDINPASVGMITDDNTDPENRLYDLYWFNQTQDQEWQNYRQGAFDLVSGNLGYLYANKNNVTLHFSGTPNTEGIVSVSLVKDDDVNWSGWNLIGNPFGEAAVLDMAFYTMNEAGDGFMAQTEGSTVNAMEGVFVKAENDGDEATFTAVSNFGFGSGSGGGADPLDEGYLNLSVNKTLGGFVDNAIVRFDGGAMLGKFQLRENSTKVYITENGKDYAIVRSNAEGGEMPVSFKAENNGTYTLSVEPKNVDMTYLHLIDNKTGADIDLLATPSYSFEARTTDYASRFRLVFNANDENGASTGSATFAFFNGSEWMINNMGEATLQVVDVMGRVLSTETVNGNATMNLNQTPGVYMLRLVNGDSVKVQKVVVR